MRMVLTRRALLAAAAACLEPSAVGSPESRRRMKLGVRRNPAGRGAGRVRPATQRAQGGTRDVRDGLFLTGTGKSKLAPETTFF